MNQKNIDLYSDLKAKKDATPQELKVIAAFDVANSIEGTSPRDEEALQKAFDELARAEKVLGSKEEAIPAQKAPEAVPDSGHTGGSGNVPSSL